MEEEKTMSLEEALRTIMDKVGNIRVPVREKKIAMMLDSVASDLYECILAIQRAEKKDELADEPEVNGDV